jgi:hypothetical protein
MWKYYISKGSCKCIKNKKRINDSFSSKNRKNKELDKYIEVWIYLSLKIKSNGIFHTTKNMGKSVF